MKCSHLDIYSYKCKYLLTKHPMKGRPQVISQQCKWLSIKRLDINGTLLRQGTEGERKGGDMWEC